MHTDFFGGNLPGLHVEGTTKKLPKSFQEALLDWAPAMHWALAEESFLAKMILNNEQKPVEHSDGCFRLRGLQSEVW